MYKHEDYLRHYGILGMKWGRRRAKTITTPSKDHARKTELKKKKVSEMSNDELRELNNRLQLEKQYRELAPKKVTIGRKFATNILKEVGKEVLKEYLKTNAKSIMKLGKK